VHNPAPQSVGILGFDQSGDGLRHRAHVSIRLELRIKSPCLFQRLRHIRRLRRSIHHHRSLKPLRLRLLRPRHILRTRQFTRRHRRRHLRRLRPWRRLNHGRRRRRLAIGLRHGKRTTQPPRADAGKSALIIIHKPLRCESVKWSGIAAERLVNQHVFSTFRKVFSRDNVHSGRAGAKIWQPGKVFHNP